MTANGRMPPHDADAEGAMLSAAMFSGATRIDEVADIVQPEHMYSEAHRRIWEACLGLVADNKPVDIQTVDSWLREHGRLEQVGGHGYLVEVMNAAPVLTQASLRAYATTVRERATLRTVLAICQYAEAEIYVGVPEPEPFTQELEEKLHQATMARKMSSVQAMKDVLRGSFQKLYDRQQAGGLAGISTGLYDLDKSTGGIHETDLTVLAARPGMGKTALALCMAMSVAQQGHGALVFSLEMPAEQLGNRALCLDARVDLGKMRHTAYNAGEWSRIVASCGTVGKLPIFIEDTGDLPLASMRTIVRRTQSDLAKQGKKLGIVIIDYVQLMSGSAQKGASREEAVSQITRGLKAMAKEAKVAVLALSQLNRGVESRTDKRPMLSDLRESGAIEQDADNVIFIYRDDYYDDESDQQHIAELIIAKQRNGATGTTRVRFDAEYTRFDNLGYDEAAE